MGMSQIPPPMVSVGVAVDVARTRGFASVTVCTGPGGLSRRLCEFDDALDLGDARRRGGNH